jgi:hypothetical protein
MVVGPKLPSNSCRGVADLFNGVEKFLVGYAEVLHPPVNFMWLTQVDVTPIFPALLQ